MRCCFVLKTYAVFTWSSKPPKITDSLMSNVRIASNYKYLFPLEEDTVSETRTQYQFKCYPKRSRNFRALVSVSADEHLQHVFLYVRLNFTVKYAQICGWIKICDIPFRCMSYLFIIVHATEIFPKIFLNKREMRKCIIQ